jgi:hypothetical protein
MLSFAPFSSLRLFRSDRFAAHAPGLCFDTRRLTVRHVLSRCAGVAALALALAAPAASFAQNKPGVPGGILEDQFRFNEHPQMPFAASSPDPKYQHGAPTARRRRADNGDASGDACNLKCGQ